MTGVARGGGRNVAGRFAGRLGSVVAACTTPCRNQRMRESSWKPARGFVTGVAWRVGHQVRGRFGQGVLRDKSAVVTASTASLLRLGCLMLEGRWRPACRQMTGIAGCRRWKMAGRLTGGATARLVARNAVAWRTSKQSLRMTGLTALAGMRAIKHESRRIVVKRRTSGRYGLSCYRSANDHCQHEQDR